MKSFTILLSMLVVYTQNFSQQTFDLPHCKCIDEIERISPALDGKYTRTCEGKLIESGIFSNGEKDGEWITYNTRGKIIRKFNYQKGKMHGPAELYYSSGEPKLTASFSNGAQDGSWTYYSDKGKKWIEGSYNHGIPVGQWIIRDKKGNNIDLQYDYAAGKYEKNSNPVFLKTNAIVQNDNTSEYFILHIPERHQNFRTLPLGGFHFSSDLFVQMVEIPLDFFNTYVSYKYQMTVDVKEDHSSTFKLKVIDDHMPDNTSIYPFIVNTNRKAKLKKIEHSAMSKTLLDYKVKEALSLLMPWTNQKASTIEVYVPYVINQIIGL